MINHWHNDQSKAQMHRPPSRSALRGPAPFSPLAPPWLVRATPTWPPPIGRIWSGCWTLIGRSRRLTPPTRQLLLNGRCDGPEPSESLRPAEWTQLSAADFLENLFVAVTRVVVLLLCLSEWWSPTRWLLWIAASTSCVSWDAARRWKKIPSLGWRIRWKWTPLDRRQRQCRRRWWWRRAAARRLPKKVSPRSASTVCCRIGVKVKPPTCRCSGRWRRLGRRRPFTAKTRTNPSTRTPIATPTTMTATWTLKTTHPAAANRRRPCHTAAFQSPVHPAPATPSTCQPPPQPPQQPPPEPSNPAELLSTSPLTWPCKWGALHSARRLPPA